MAHCNAVQHADERVGEDHCKSCCADNHFPPHTGTQVLLLEALQHLIHLYEGCLALLSEIQATLHHEQLTLLKMSLQ